MLLNEAQKMERRVSSRPNMLFENLDLENCFTPVKGKVAGIDKKILANDFDHEARLGKRPRLWRLASEVQTPAAYDHPHWEELNVISAV